MLLQRAFQKRIYLGRATVVASEVGGRSVVRFTEHAARAGRVLPAASGEVVLDSPKDGAAMIGERLKSLLAGDKTFKSFPGLGDDASLFESGVIDSFGMIALVIQIEGEFGIKVRPEEATVQNFRSISSIARLVEAKTDGRHRG